MFIESENILSSGGGGGDTRIQELSSVGRG